VITDERIIVVGAGGHGAEIYSYLQDGLRNSWKGQLLGFLDDSKPVGKLGDLPVIGTLDALVGYDPDFFRGIHYLTAIGSNKTRREIVRRIESMYGDRMPPWTLVHPESSIGSDVLIGAGTCICPHVTLTTRISIGKHAIINVNTSMSHDSVLEDFVCLNPGVTVCGNVHIGEGTYVGAGSTIIQGVRIGRNSIIGAGAVVVRDIPDNVTALGVPARVVKTQV
jgi:sugar O-acyltransferase (sialic acid O-acetyltransferase NeuD family)